MLQAVFWDMDGTIVDTEPYWFKAQEQLMARFGIPWAEDQAKLLIGKALPDSAQILRNAGAELHINEMVQLLTELVLDQVRGHILWRPGAREMLADLCEAGIRCVLVTMSRRPLAEEIVRHLPPDTFDFLITGEMVRHGKPHPEPYLMAAERLSRSVQDLTMGRIVAIEDSLPGIASANASGVVTLGVPNMVPLPETPGVRLWPTLEHRTLSDLRALVAPLPLAELHT